MQVELEIVSPEKLLLSRAVDMVVIPAAEGDMGVLPLHAPMIVLLRGGTIAIYEGSQVTDRLYVSGGFAEITPERCTVLADEAIPAGELSGETARQRLDQAQQDYQETDTQDGPALEAAMERVQAAQAMVDAVAA